MDISESIKGQTDYLSLVEEEISKLEEAKYTLLVNSGMSTILSVLQLLGNGGTIIVQDDFYSGVRHAMNKIYHQKFNFVTAKHDNHLETIEQELSKNEVKLIHLETPSNPLLHIYDIEEISKLCKKHNVLLSVDCTFCTPIFMKPLRMGADLVLHSATKFLGGHSDLLAGSISTNNQELYQRLLVTRDLMGNKLSNFTSFFLYEGLQTLRIRCLKQMENGIKVANFLKNHPKVEKTLFPLFEDHPGYEIMRKQSSGFTGMLSFYLKSDNFDTLCEFAKNLKIIKFGTSLGGVDSVIDHFGGTVRIYYTKEQQVERGYTDNFFRMSLGIEDSEDLLKDLEEALNKIE